MARPHGDKAMIKYEDRVGHFFEVLRNLDNPAVRFIDREDVPLLAVSSTGLEELAPIAIGNYDLRLDPIFSGESRLSWDEIVSIDFEKGRLGAHHVSQIRFVNLDTTSKRLSDDKVWLLNRALAQMDMPPNHYRLPHNEVHKIEIDGTDVEAVLQGFNGKQRTRALESVFRQIAGGPVQIVEEGYADGPRELTEDQKALVAMHARRMKRMSEGLN